MEILGSFEGHPKSRVLELGSDLVEHDHRRGPLERLQFGVDERGRLAAGEEIHFEAADFLEVRLLVFEWAEGHADEGELVEDEVLELARLGEVLVRVVSE